MAKSKGSVSVSSWLSVNSLKRLSGAVHETVSLLAPLPIRGLLGRQLGSPIHHVRVISIPSEEGPLGRGTSLVKKGLHEKLIRLQLLFRGAVLDSIHLLQHYAVLPLYIVVASLVALPMTMQFVVDDALPELFVQKGGRQELLAFTGSPT